MLFNGSIALNADPQRVWDLLLDLSSLTACVPGVDNLVQVDDGTFTGTIHATVGPMSGEFPFRAHIEDSDPPTDLSARVEGTDSITKSTIDADVRVTLASMGLNQTVLTYQATVNIHGRLAIIGDMVLRATAAVILNEFTKRIRARLDGDIAEVKA